MAIGVPFCKWKVPDFFRAAPHLEKRVNVLAQKEIEDRCES